ncbi:LacI family transcriptional regulator [Cryobacterium lactosi]|uniref:LacI family transcriptional regulator n=2 Tax=Cryobacterium lactosi TaxID=1259202 RepID=A0A4R9BQ85_9MICO|nr:LacI family transcriptional regulator [Cryobacterium lactosi]
MTGLSLSTISKHYNGLPVREKNRLAIESAAATLGFRLNGFARSLRSRRSLTVGVLLPALDNDFHLTIIAGVEAALRSDGISILVCSSRPAPGEAVDFLMSKMVDGIIAVPTSSDVEALRLVAAQGVPVVAIDWIAPELDTDRVVLDNVAAGAAVARHLADYGHQRVALVGGDPMISTMRDRADGFRRALATRGISIADEYISSGPLTAENGQAATEKLLALPERPTALFAANYELTLGMLIAVNESGLRVPDDISLVGFDSLELARAVRPRLTVYKQPTLEIADEAARLIRARLDGSASATHGTSSLTGRLIVGASVAALH